MQQLAQQSAELSDAKNANAELGTHINSVREAIADQEAILSSTTGLLP